MRPAGYCEINHQKRSCWTFCRSLCPCVGEREWASRILNSPLRDDQSLKEMDAAFKGTWREKGRVSSNHLTTYFWHSFYLTAFQRSRTPAWRRGKRCPGACQGVVYTLMCSYRCIIVHTGTHTAREASLERTQQSVSLFLRSRRTDYTQACFMTFRGKQTTLAAIMGKVLTEHTVLVSCQTQNVKAWTN